MSTNQDSANINYSNLVLGLSSAALSYMGQAGAEVAKNCELAQHNIEIISMLREKTSGNLTPEEEALTDQVLADLQMKYVETFKT